MEDKKPCDDIFEGLADLIIDNGLTVNEYHKSYSEYSYPSEYIDHKTDAYTIRYFEREYIIVKTDGVIDSIRRIRIHDEESEDD